MGEAEHFATCIHWCLQEPDLALKQYHTLPALRISWTPAVVGPGGPEACDALQPLNSGTTWPKSAGPSPSQSCLPPLAAEGCSSNQGLEEDADAVAQVDEGAARRQ